MRGRYVDFTDEEGTEMASRRVGTGVCNALKVIHVGVNPSGWTGRRPRIGPGRKAFLFPSLWLSKQLSASTLQFC